MKIIPRSEFVKLPSGVLYAKYEPHIFEEISIKGDTISNDDWFYSDLLEIESRSSGEAIDIADKAIQDQTSFALDFDVESRDGCFEKEQLFAVYEKEDVILLVERLIQNLTKYPDKF